MKCFFHQDRDAVGICKSCERGVCSECAVDLGKGLACKGRCEDDAKALIALVQSNLRTAPSVNALLRKGRSAGLQLAGLYLLLGLVFLAWDLASERLQFTGVLGGLFFLYGIILTVRAIRAPTFGEYEEATQPNAQPDGEDATG